MMLGTVIGATLVGQLMSRVGGSYRFLGMISVAIMTGGLYLMSRVDIDTARGLVISSMVMMGLGMGGTFPALNIAVQNAVAYRNLGTATAAVQFVRAIGASVGLALLGSLLTTRFAAGVDSNVAREVLERIPIGILNDLKGNPDALVNEDQIAELTVRLAEAGPETAALTETLLAGMRHALAGAVGEVLLATVFAAAAAFFVIAFLREIPLKKGGPSV
jgi:hypothetical protein